MTESLYTTKQKIFLTMTSIGGLGIFYDIYQNFTTSKYIMMPIEFVGIIGFVLFMASLESEPAKKKEGETN